MQCKNVLLTPGFSEVAAVASYLASSDTRELCNALQVPRCDVAVVDRRCHAHCVVFGFEEFERFTASVDIQSLAPHSMLLMLQPLVQHQVVDPT
jgi:hypothetical protein